MNRKEMIEKAYLKSHCMSLDEITEIVDIVINEALDEAIEAVKEEQHFEYGSSRVYKKRIIKKIEAKKVSDETNNKAPSMERNKEG